MHRCCWLRVNTVFSILTIAAILAAPMRSLSASASQQTTSECGAWKAEESINEKDQRIRVAPVTVDDSSCLGVYTLSNQTSVQWRGLSFGGYTLELETSPINATVQWKPLGDPDGKNYLTPLMALDIQATPIDVSSKGAVAIHGNMTWRSLVIDSALFLLKAFLELAPLPTGCLISEDQLAFAAIRASFILEPVVDLVFKRDFPGAGRELSSRLGEFIEGLGDYMEDASIDCGVEWIAYVRGIAKKPVAIVKLVAAYLAWIPVVWIDYWKYKGEPASVILSYAPNTPQDLIAYIGVDENLWLVQPDGSNPIQVTSDGKPGSSIWTPIVGYSDIRWSPDGKRIAVIRRDKTGSWLQIINIGELSVISILSGIGDSFDWLPDGNSIVYSEIPYQTNPIDPAQPGGLSIIDLQSGDKRRLIESGSQLRFVNPDWSPKGTNLFFYTQPVPFPDAIWASGFRILDTQSGNYHEPAGLLSPSCSWEPDGERLICGGTILEFPYPELIILSKSGQVLGTIGGAGPYDAHRNPIWSPNGRYIAYELIPCCPYEGSALEVIELTGNDMASVSRISQSNIVPLEWSSDSTRLLAIQNPFVEPNVVILDIATREMVKIASASEASWRPTYPFPNAGLMPELSLLPPEPACPDALPTRLQIEGYAYVSLDPPLSNRVRSGAGRNYAVLGSIQPGKTVEVLEGPACADNGAWWKVRVIDTGLVGWTAEGDIRSYWLIPCNPVDTCGKP